jgi:dipeptidase E
MTLLLLSNSRSPGKEFLEHALPVIGDVVAGRRHGVFLPFANVMPGWDAITERTNAALAPLGVALTGAHTVADPAAALAAADFVMVSGGNTFRLLAEARARGWLDAIAAAVAAGLPYIGWSAGANLAAPTIATTNDMPIIDPKGFEALALVPFQINAHYTDRVIEGHGGESREQRLREFLALNPQSVVLGLPEGTWLRRTGGALMLEGGAPAVLFRHGRDIEPVAPGPIDPAEFLPLA